MANPILVTGAAGRVGEVGRTVTALLLQQGNAVRAMVRTEDARARALRAMGQDVLISNFGRYFRLVDYLAGYTQKPIGIAVGIPLAAGDFRCGLLQRTYREAC
jgi:nucleoside-diphosphate-sugar epimerase